MSHFAAQPDLLATCCTPAGMRTFRVVHGSAGVLAVHRTARFGSRRWRRTGIDVRMKAERAMLFRGKGSSRSGVAPHLNSVEWGNLPVFGGEQGWRAIRQGAGDRR